jgi:biofilm PGA synthesis lipoprotein PgaB
VAALAAGVPPRLPAADRGDLLVLCYHGLDSGRSDGGAAGPGSDSYSVQAVAFAEQLAVLRAAAFRPVSLTQVVAARRGGPPLPPRPVLVTFDDGSASQWELADPVLVAYGFEAVTFLITSRLGSGPGYLTWPEVTAMAASRRWAAAAHTHALHQRVPTGPGLPDASVLVNRIWDPQTGRLEDPAAARTRVDADVTAQLADFAAHALPPPSAFAYPFSEVSSPTNDPAFATWVRRRLGSTYELLMTNGWPPQVDPIRVLRDGLVHRVEVRSDVSAETLVAMVVAAGSRAD